jgi:hypothetical protein
MSTINANTKQTLNLAAGSVLSVAAPSGTTGLAVRLSRIPGGDTQSVTVINGSDLTFGPYGDLERFYITCDTGTVTVTIAAYTPADNATDAEVSALLGTFQLTEKTPHNAVAASKLLTIGTNPAEGATVSIGGVTYKFRVAIGAGAAASKKLSSNNTEVTDGDTVTVGEITYRFKDTPSQANDIGRHGTDADVTLGRLVKAINGTGIAGSDYFAGTEASPVCTSGEVISHEIIVTAKSLGFAGNDISIAESSGVLSWAGAATKLSGGIDPQAANDVLISDTTEHSIDNLVLAITYDAGEGTSEGTKYGTGTVANPLATAVKASAATMTATNKIRGVIGNDTVIAETLADGSWAAGATKLSGGIDGTVGAANETCADASNIYHCIAANTIADANWRAISLGSAF